MANTAMDQLTGLGKLYDSINGLFGGGTNGGKEITQTQSTSGGRTVSGLDISDAGIQRIINQMLAGPGGVKDISGAARGAGLFNSSTEALMRNDLATRVAGEAAKQSAKTVTTTDPVATTTNTTIAPTGGISPLQGLLGVGGLKLAGSLLGGSSAGAASSGAGSITGALNNLSDTIFGTSGISPALAATSIPNLAGQTFNSIDDLLAAPAMADAVGGVNAATGVSGVGAGLANLPLTSYLGPIASLAGGIFGGKKAVESPIGMGMSAIGTGLALAPALGPLAPLGFLAGPALTGLGSLFGGNSVICTALKKRGLLDPVEYALGEEYLRTLSAYTISGYYLWGLNVAEAINRGNKWAIRLTLPWASSRMHLLASHSKWKYVKYPLGSITKFIGQPICWSLGLILSLVGVNYAV